LTYLDKDSTAANDLLEKAKTALKQKAQSAVDDARSKIGF